MSYKKSRARKTFETTVGELLKLAREISYKKVNLPYPQKNLIFQSTIVLTGSAIEEYLRVFIEDLVFSYRTNNATIGDLPVNFRTLSLLSFQKPSYGRYIYTQNEKHALRDLDVTAQRLFELANPTTVFSTQVTAEQVLKDKKYPTVDNLKILFNRFGIPNFLHSINAAGHKDYKLDIDAFQSLRTTIAHQSQVNLTFPDVKRNIDNMADVINRIDRMCCGQVSTTSALTYWLSIC